MIYLGIVHRPEDIRKGRKSIIEKELMDLNPSIRDSVLTIIESWKGEESNIKLKKLIGNSRTNYLRRRFKKK